MATAKQSNQTDDQRATEQDDGPMMLTDTGDVVPSPAAGGESVPYDIGGLPAVRSSEDAKATRRVLVYQQDGEVGVALDGAPRQSYTVKNGAIDVPVAVAARIAAALPGARLEED